MAYPSIPGEKLPFTFEIKADDYFKLNKNNLHYGIHVGYFINNKESYTIGKIWKLDSSGVGIKEYWIDEPKT